MWARLQPTARYVLLVLAVVSTSCSGGGARDAPPTAPGTQAQSVATSIVVANGSGQTARIKSVVPIPPSVVVRDQRGVVMAGVTVTFAVSGGGGSATGLSATTDANGVATVGTWTLGATAGTNTLTAQVSGVPVSTVITATARLPYWTVLVYMAGDNTLAAFGVVSLAQMAAAGVNPEVQVVVQAEFSPTYLAQYGLSPANFGRANYNTFRYVMDGTVSAGSLGGRPVLAGPTTDIGNVNMVDPATLHDFLSWGQQTAPAQRTMVILWNHGGAQQGLIEDDTSSPNVYMSLPQLTSAFSGIHTADILDFQMCLMGGYEALSSIHSVATTVIASEEEEIVNGWDFTGLLSTLYANPNGPTTTLTTALADRADAAYASLPVTSTISAYNMGGFATVDAAVTQLAGALSAAAANNAPAISSAAAVAQGFSYPWLRDVVDFADSLRTHTSDSAVVSAAGAVRSAVTSSGFLLANHTRSGTSNTSYQPHSVSRARGLQIVMPANMADGLASSGPGSLASYEQNFPTTSWGTFLQKWVPLSNALRSTVDVGTNTTTVWVVWDTVFAKRGVMQMLLLEPDGSLYGPAFGTVSPSGLFSADAQATQAYYEGWKSERFVESGNFLFIAWLVSDSTNYRPLVNVAYQVGAGAVTNLYTVGTYPQLSLAQSFTADPSSTLNKALTNVYSDFKVVAQWVPVSGSQSASLAGLSGLSVKSSTGAAMTTAQAATLRKLAPALLRAKHEVPAGDPAAIRQRLEAAVRAQRIAVPQP